MNQQSSQLIKKGQYEFKQHDYQKSIEFFTQAAMVDEKNEVIYYNRSASYANLQKYELALQDANKCIELNPGWSQGYYRKGNAEQYLDRVDEAIDSFTKGLQCDPKDQKIKKALSKVKNQKNPGMVSTTFTEPISNNSYSQDFGYQLPNANLVTHHNSVQVNPSSGNDFNQGGQIMHLANQVKLKEQENRKLENDLYQKQNAFIKLNEALGQKEDDLNQLNLNLKSMIDENKKLFHGINNKDEEVESLNEQIQNLTEENEKMSESAANLQRENEKFKYKLSANETEIETLKQEVQSRQDENEKLYVVSLFKDNKIADLKAQAGVVNKDEELDKLNETINNLNEENEKLQEEIKNAQNEKDSIKNNKFNSNTEIEQLKQDIQSRQDENEKLYVVSLFKDNKIADLKQKYEQMKELYEGAEDQSQGQQPNEKVKTLQNELSIKDRKIEELNTTISNIHQSQNVNVSQQESFQKMWICQSCLKENPYNVNRCQICQEIMPDSQQRYEFSSKNFQDLNNEQFLQLIVSDIAFTGNNKQEEKEDLVDSDDNLDSPQMKLNNQSEQAEDIVNQRQVLRQYIQELIQRRQNNNVGENYSSGSKHMIEELNQLQSENEELKQSNKRETNKNMLLVRNNEDLQQQVEGKNRSGNQFLNSFNDDQNNNNQFLSGGVKLVLIEDNKTTEKYLNGQSEIKIRIQSIQQE